MGQAELVSLLTVSLVPVGPPPVFFFYSFSYRIIYLNLLADNFGNASISY